MDKQKYFNKNGYVFGVSFKDGYNPLTTYTIKFTNWKEAMEWLETEEYDFRHRRLISKSEARKIDRIIL